ncbi:MAG TPA: trypsin-like peptidase domain-containing protein [Terriglobales bacterium]|jgi:S1-C subfamily serine protease|nr:trypsin-like peptidase domain-containing protein [Terriglobales bacterium]
MSKELIEFSNALAQVTERASAIVVAVHTETRGSSSGIVWRPGVIVTSEHALRHDEEIQLTLPIGRVVPATLVGRDPSTDIAVLKCSEADTAVALFGDVSALKPGTLTLVVGRTRASGPVAALGVVSLLASDRRTWTGASLTPYIRLDIGLQPTAIGGAVIDASGNLVGLATPRFARFGAIAVPASTINKISDTLLKQGRIPRGYLGVGLQPVRLPNSLREMLQRNEKTAAIALEVHPGGPADKAGIVIGDILVSLGGQSITRLEDVQSLLAGDAIGKTLPLKFIRGGAVQDGNIVVAERPHGGE